MPDPASIVAFTKDWNDVPTCTTHILRAMGQTRPVLWVNSIGMRKPSLASGRDLPRITVIIADPDEFSGVTGKYLVPALQAHPEKLDVAATVGRTVIYDVK